MKKELYSIPKAVTAVYYDGGNFSEIQEVAPKAILENIELPLVKTSEMYGDMFYTTTQVRVVLNGDKSDRYDNILYPGQWVIAKKYSNSRYHKNESDTEEVWFEILDNIDDYIETSKVTINN
jgi:hypothetical protein